MINAKERFGYTCIISTDRIEQNILSAFCEGKSYFWNSFLGWRRSKRFDDYEEQVFWIPSNKIEVLAFLSEEIKRKEK